MNLIIYLFVQVIIGLASLLGGIVVGMSMSYSAVLLPTLQLPNSTIFVDEEMGSWIGMYK